MMNVLITGGSGFVGTNLVEHYAAAGCEVLNIDIAPPRNPEHKHFWKKVDVCDGPHLRTVVREFAPELVFHMAARTDLNGATLADYSANVDGVRWMIEALADVPTLKRAVFASSMLVCPLGYHPRNDEDYCPNTIYGESKVEGERLVKSLAFERFPWVIVRPTSLWGPWFAVPYRNFFDAVAAKLYLHPKSIRIKRSYGFVLNAVAQLHKLASCGQGELVDGKVFYLADYIPIELYEWACQISADFNVHPPKEVPLGVLKFFATAGDVLKRIGVRNPPLSSFRLNNLLTEAVFDMHALENIAGPLPYDSSTGVEVTVDWIKKQH